MLSEEAPFWRLAPQLSEITCSGTVGIFEGSAPILPGKSEHGAHLLISWLHTHSGSTNTHWIEPTNMYHIRQSHDDFQKMYQPVQILCAEPPNTAVTGNSRRELPAGNPRQTNDSEGIMVGQPLAVNFRRTFGLYSNGDVQVTQY